MNEGHPRMNRVIKFSLINAMRVRKVLKRGRSIIITARQLGAVHMSCPMARPAQEGHREGRGCGRGNIEGKVDEGILLPRRQQSMNNDVVTGQVYTTLSLIGVIAVPCL